MAGTLLNSTNFKSTDANDQLNATLNQNGLLMRMAKTKGQQSAGSRGLMNSSIGSEASMRAMVDAAWTGAVRGQVKKSLAAWPAAAPAE